MTPEEKLHDVNRRARKAYVKWVNLKNHPDWKTMDVRWRRGGGLGYQAFIEDVGFPPSMGHSLMRIDRTKPFQKGNVEWVLTHGEHGNKKHFITFLGRDMSIKDAAAFLGIKPLSLSIKLKRWAKKHKRNTFTLEELTKGDL